MTGLLPPRRILLVKEFTNDGLALSIHSPHNHLVASRYSEGYGWYVYNIPYRVYMTVAYGAVEGEAGEG